MSFRSLFAVALAALVATPAMAATQTKKASTQAAPARTTSAASSTSAGGLKDLTIGASIGYETGDLDGLALRVDGEMPIRKLTPKVGLSGVVSIGYSRLGYDAGVAEATWNILKVIPAARFTLPVAPQLNLYGDAGLGLYYGSATVKTTLPFVGTVEDSTSTTGFLMRFGVGGMYQLNPKLKLTGELGLMPYFGDADTTNWTFSVGAMFAI